MAVPRSGLLLLDADRLRARLSLNVDICQGHKKVLACYALLMSIQPTDFRISSTPGGRSYLSHFSITDRGVRSSFTNAKFPTGYPPAGSFRKSRKYGHLRLNRHE